MARMRKKKNLVSRTEACAEHFFEEPKDNRGKWREACGMPSDCRMFVEIGCGKGSFSEQMARKYLMCAMLRSSVSRRAAFSRWKKHSARA